MRQFVKSNECSREQAEVKLREIFGSDEIFVIGQGFNINFALPLDVVITEEQIDDLRNMNWKLVQIKPVINESGMRDHLHIHVREIHEWE